MTTATTPATLAQPPPIDPANVVELVSVKDSTIIGISLYSSRAEVKRKFKVAVKTGLNHVHIDGLPNVFEEDTLRVEGRGPATIHDVTVSTMPTPPPPTDSEALTSLYEQQERTNLALERAKKSNSALDRYLKSLSVEHLDVTQLSKVSLEYDAAAEALDTKISKLTKESKRLEKEITAEKEKLATPDTNINLKKRVSIGVFAEGAVDVELVLIYAVASASWSAGYDIRAEMDTKEKPITMAYKAIVNQHTGEDWNDVPLALETASPTFGVGVPNLSPWHLSTYRATLNYYKLARSGGGFRGAALFGAPSASLAAGATGVDSYDFAIEETCKSTGKRMEQRELVVSSKGNVSATFQVPGVVTIPSDSSMRNFTIVTLELDATMNWICVPKEDTKVHLKAKIQNSSEYTFLAGLASVYVNGSFISRSAVPAVSPQESFSCSLGLDPSIRVTYHPRVKKVTESGFYAKTLSSTYTQRVSIHNTKTVAIGHLKILDQVPVSQDASITVKLVQPSLPAPVGEGDNKSSKLSMTVKGVTGSGPLASVKISDGVTAQWDTGDDDAEDGAIDVESVGKDGKFNWACAVPQQGKVNVSLVWEVTCPARTRIDGLE